MTHYMQLLADNQPWNLIMFMVIPVVLAETVAVTELYILFTRKFSGKVKRLNTAAGAIAGVYFLGVFIYLLINAVVPLTVSGQWRGFADVVAVLFGFFFQEQVRDPPLDEIGLARLHGARHHDFGVFGFFIFVLCVKLCGGNGFGHSVSPGMKIIYISQING